MEQLDVAPTPQLVSRELASVAHSTRACSTFSARGSRYRIRLLPFPRYGQRSVAIVLEFAQQGVPTTEDLVMIKQDNVLIQLEEATPAKPKLPLLVRSAAAAVQRVVAAES
jgi:hypothetical protein